MTGPEHYAEAERLAYVAAECQPQFSGTFAALANAHATLALAAAMERLAPQMYPTYVVRGGQT